MKLKEELEAAGYKKDPDDFSDAVVDMFVAMYPNMTDEELLCCPTLALKFVVAVQLKNRLHELHESVICKTLINARKRGNGANRK